MEPEEPEEPENGEGEQGQENAAGTETAGHQIRMEKKEKERDGKNPHTLPGGMAGADPGGPGPDAILRETGKKGGTDKKPGIAHPATGVERKTEVQGMSKMPSPDDPALVRRRTERDLKDNYSDMPYVKTEKAVRDLVCSLIERQDRMNADIFLAITSMQEDSGMLKDQVFRLKDHENRSGSRS